MLHVGALLLSAVLAAPGTLLDEAHGDHDHVLPDRRDDRATLAERYRGAGDWLIAPAEAPTDGGTRVAAMIDVAASGGPLALEARGTGGDRVGPWRPLEETFRGAGQRVAVVDLDGHYPAAELRVARADAARIDAIAWELLTPRFPTAGRDARAAAAVAGEVVYAVDPTLATLGVVPREAWGARPTQCSAREDDWYRMAIHHTAGPQTSGGAVDQVVRGLQAYAQDSGEYCDIPYQFLVGFDGSLWEARPLEFTSGATGGGNNPGNLAVCFMGCYHPNSCPGGNSHAATPEMLASAHLLVQTLTRLHGIPAGDGDIRGHRDWPGNATACPGDFVHERLGELRADLAWFTAGEVARSFAADGRVGGAPGESVEVWVELENRGGMTWQPGVTFLAPTPRDVASPLADPSWPSPTRAATVAATVAPGEIGRFAFRVVVPASGEVTQAFGLVEEAVTWFADAPWGGGPGDGAIALTVAPGDGGDGDGDGDGDDGDEVGDVSAGCAAGRGAPTWLAALALLALAGRLRAR